MKHVSWVSARIWISMCLAPRPASPGRRCRLRRCRFAGHRKWLALTSELTRASFRPPAVALTNNGNPSWAQSEQVLATQVAYASRARHDWHTASAPLREPPPYHPWLRWRRLGPMNRCPHPRRLTKSRAQRKPWRVDCTGRISSPLRVSYPRGMDRRRGRASRPRRHSGH
jgi:hypothetical protein